MCNFDAKMAAIEAALLDERRLIDEDIAAVRQARADGQERRRASRRTSNPTEEAGTESAGSGELDDVEEDDEAGVADLDHQRDEFLTPAVDPETGEPIYDSVVVAGKKTLRLRAYAAARVYGPYLRSLALATAIFATGETNASSPESVRASLRGLVKYRPGWWERESGAFRYLRELVPDVEMISYLSGTTDNAAIEGPVQGA